MSSEVLVIRLSVDLKYDEFIGCYLADGGVFGFCIGEVWCSKVVE